MTRKTRKKLDNIINCLIIIVIVVILAFFVNKTYNEYLLEKEDLKITEELEQLLSNDLTLYEEYLPEETSERITILGPTNEDMLVSNISYFGIIEIPKYSIRKPIVNGTTRKDIANKVGYDNHSGIPGKKGNVVLAAHNAWNFFGRINGMKNGDIIRLTTRDGRFTYKVFDVFKVHKSETWVYNEIEGHEKMITLITCVYPDSNYRWIVRGQQE